MRYRILIIAICLSLDFYAQDNTPLVLDPVVTNSFWDNWYGQVGADMHLQFPEGHNMKDVFPNGESFGIDVAVGKWVSHHFSVRSFKI